MPASFEIEFLNPADLIPQSANWRTHNTRQADALSGSLADFGWLSAPIVNKRNGRLIDGHLRVEHARNVGADAIPCRVIDVDEATEKRILATFDRVGQLAGTDDAALLAILKDVQETDGSLPSGWDEVDYGNLALRLAAQQQEAVPDFDPTSLGDQGALDRKAMVICPECSHEFVP